MSHAPNIQVLLEAWKDQEINASRLAGLIHLGSPSDDLLEEAATLLATPVFWDQVIGPDIAFNLLEALDPHIPKLDPRHAKAILKALTAFYQQAVSFWAPMFNKYKAAALASGLDVPTWPSPDAASGSFDAFVPRLLPTGSMQHILAAGTVVPMLTELFAKPLFPDFLCCLLPLCTDTTIWPLEAWEIVLEKASPDHLQLLVAQMPLAQISKWPRAFVVKLLARGTPATKAYLFAKLPYLGGPIAPAAPSR